MTRPTRRDWTQGNLARTGGYLVNYVQMGDGPILVLLHKLGGWAREWTALAGERILFDDLDQRKLQATSLATGRS